VEDGHALRRHGTQKEAAMHPDSHRRYDSERLADRLREARHAELVAKLEETAPQERKPLAVRFWRGRFAARLTANHA
jgi:hypothetical protein